MRLAEGAVVVRRQVKRARVLLFFSRLRRWLIGMEACAGAHFWARERAKLGHDVRLMPPSYVKPFVKRGKTDRADAGASLAKRDCARTCLRAGQGRGFGRQC
jgi:transposase